MTTYLDGIAARAVSLVPANPTPAVTEYLASPVSHVRTLPWPFAEEVSTYRYSVNVDPARTVRTTAAGEWGRHIVDLGGAEYPLIMAERRHVLATDPDRVKVRRGMDLACWDLLLFYLRDLAQSYPDLMSLEEDGDVLNWRNDVLGTDQRFVLGDSASLPGGPLVFLAGEIPDDLILMVERDGRMYFEAGAVTFAAGWAATFDVGMNMYEIHQPVPRMTATGMTARAEQFLRNVTTEQPFRRINWSFANSPTRTFDISLERLTEWGTHLPAALRDGNVADMQFRIEVEHFIRLPASGAVTFNIRSHMASLAEIRTVPAWSYQLANVLEELPDDMASYKSFLTCRREMVEFLRNETP